MTDLYAILTPIGETTMANDNSVGDDNLLGEITNEQKALAAVRQDGLALGNVPKYLRDKL